MRDPHDKITAELPEVSPQKKRGRPSTGSAKTEKERQAAYRDRLTRKGGVRVTLYCEDVVLIRALLAENQSEQAQSLLARLSRND